MLYYLTGSLNSVKNYETYHKNDLLCVCPKVLSSQATLGFLFSLFCFLYFFFLWDYFDFFSEFLVSFTINKEYFNAVYCNCAHQVAQLMLDIFFKHLEILLGEALSPSHRL